MTARWRFAIVCGPRRWDGGACRAASQHRSRGLRCEASPGRWTDHPSAGAGVRIAAKLASETPRDWWIGQPSVARPSEAAGQGVPRATQPDTGHGRRARMGASPDALPLLPPRHPERHAAAGLDVSLGHLLSGALDRTVARTTHSRLVSDPTSPWRNAGGHATLLKTLSPARAGGGSGAREGRRTASPAAGDGQAGPRTNSPPGTYVGGNATALFAGARPNERHVSARVRRFVAMRHLLPQH
jgi:hypothetical protein